MLRSVRSVDSPTPAPNPDLAHNSVFCRVSHSLTPVPDPDRADNAQFHQEAVALEGFAELAEILRAARRGAAGPEGALSGVAYAYSRFASENPALYDAMFTRTSRACDLEPRTLQRR